MRPSRDCERDGYRLWGDQLLYDWLAGTDTETRYSVIAWVVALVEKPSSVEGTPIPFDQLDARCAFVPGSDVAVTWTVDENQCIVWLIEVESLADLGG